MTVCVALHLILKTVNHHFAAHLQFVNNVEGWLYKSYTFILMKNEQSCKLQIFFPLYSARAQENIPLNETPFSNITLVYNYCTLICHCYTHTLYFN